MRLNYLLAMPKLVQTVGDGYVFPLGMAYVSACLKAGGFNVFTVNLNHKEGDINDILREIIEDNDIVGNSNHDKSKCAMYYLIPLFPN